MSATLEVAIFLSMNGKAKEAIDFYKQHLNAEELLLVTYEDLAKRDSSMHLRMKISIILLIPSYPLEKQKS